MLGRGRGGRRLTLEAPDGRVLVRDLSRPGARTIELELPDGVRVRVAEHLCGWAAGPGAAAAGARPDRPDRPGPRVSPPPRSSPSWRTTDSRMRWPRSASPGS